ncbi:protein of unknown function [Paraburkholderia dioscoreae]|uniref:Uncharacterized protein n=1 Tax=Paraburkholderia dioscoreae TaxID=2604047 RepID=A0A5Q4ZLF5_9BURK|nr:protein of unknown function [Paraburkholderia dioscoreae]
MRAGVESSARVTVKSRLARVSTVPVGKLATGSLRTVAKPVLSPFSGLFVSRPVGGLPNLRYHDRMGREAGTSIYRRRLSANSKYG